MLRKPTNNQNDRHKSPRDLTFLPSQQQFEARKDKMSKNFQMILMPRYATMSKITENLFLTGIGGMTSDNFEKYKITCVINATIEAPNVRLENVESIRISVEDSPNEDIGKYFDEIADKVNEVAARGGRTVVHCVFGVSRSASLAIAYLIKYERMSLKNAFNFVYEKRHVVRPNNGFFKQMIEFEKRTLGVQSVKMVSIEKAGKRFEIPDFFETEHKRIVLLKCVKAKAE